MMQDRAFRATALGAIVGVALGVLVAATTDVPLAPDLGAVIGGLIGWLFFRDRR